MSKTLLLSVGEALLLALLAGCGQAGTQLAPVSGRVTLNGQPLESADVLFQPDGALRPSIGRTNAEGRYELAHKRDVHGAIVGRHTVRIAEVTSITNRPQRVPARYHTESDLRRDIEPGIHNVFDFDLTSSAN